MKLWIKYLIGALFGAAFAFILPLGNEQVAAAVSFVTEIVVRFGRYMVVPVVFFTAVIAFNRLRDTKMLFKTGISLFLCSWESLCHIMICYCDSLMSHVKSRFNYFFCFTYSIHFRFICMCMKLNTFFFFIIYKIIIIIFNKLNHIWKKDMII